MSVSVGSPGFCFTDKVFLYLVRAEASVLLYEVSCCLVI